MLHYLRPVTFQETRTGKADMRKAPALYFQFCDIFGNGSGDDYKLLRMSFGFLCCWYRVN